jgi:hypothetical protein
MPPYWTLSDLLSAFIYSSLHYQPNPTHFLDLGTPESSPSEPKEVELIAAMQIRAPEEDLPLPPLSELVMGHRFPSSPPHGRVMPQGEPPRDPAGPRVSAMFSCG